MVDVTISGLRRKEFAVDPIVAPRYSATASIACS
jgi:hypothetical protein